MKMEGQDVRDWEVYKGGELPDEGDPEKNSGSIETRTRTLREENEQCIILCKNCLFRQACYKPYIYTNFDL